MFTLSDKRKVLWPVTIQEPSADGSGLLLDCKIRVLYTLLDRDEMAAAVRDAPDGTESLSASLSPENLEKDDQWLAARIHGWHDVQDENKMDIPFDPQKLAAMLRIPYAKKALDAGLWEASRGAPAKN